MVIYIFNPETDYALADGSSVYTAPASVRQMRDQLVLLPALYAEYGSSILLPFGLSKANVLTGPLYEICRFKGIEIIAFSEAYTLLSNANAIRPWGWNAALHKRLEDCGAKRNILPTQEKLEFLRDLSHRRTTILFHEFFHRHGYMEFDVPEEIFETNRALKRFDDCKNLYFKAPWSSSGRGIMLTDDLDIKHVEPWIRGIVGSQGSVLCEKAYDRLMDFASEWSYKDGQAQFVGLSLFSTSRRGKYHLNYLYDDSEIIRKVAGKTDIPLSDIIDLQKRALQYVIGKRYEGPLGIDMFVTSDRKINPCVEINFRMTMGMVSNHIARTIGVADKAEADIYRKIFPGKEFDLRHLVTR